MTARSYPAPGLPGADGPEDRAHRRARAARVKPHETGPESSRGCSVARVLLAANPAHIPHVIAQLLTRTAGALPASKRLRLRGALQELLFNAVEHGVLALGYRAKRRALAQGVYEAVLQARVAAARVRRRPVTIEIRHEPKARSLTYRISDAGRGFNWRRCLTRVPPRGEAVALSGRGIVLARALCPNLTYNERGNEVIITVPLA